METAYSVYVELFLPTFSAIRWVSEIIEIAGGDDVFSEKSFGKLASEREIQWEDVIEMNPDIIPRLAREPYTFSENTDPEKECIICMDLIGDIEEEWVLPYELFIFNEEKINFSLKLDSSLGLNVELFQQKQVIH